MTRLYWFVAEGAGELISAGTSSAPLLIQTGIQFLLSWPVFICRNVRNVSASRVQQVTISKCKNKKKEEFKAQK